MRYFEVMWELAPETDKRWWLAEIVFGGRKQTQRIWLSSWATCAEACVAQVREERKEPQ